MKVDSIEQAKQLIQQYQGAAEHFYLDIPMNGLVLADQHLPLSLTMAIITDKILEKGWMPDGFTELSDHLRRYYYSS